MKIERVSIDNFISLPYEEALFLLCSLEVVQLGSVSLSLQGFKCFYALTTFEM